MKATTEKKPTKTLARKIIAYLGEHGLTPGLGEPKPGQMCVEAMICHLMGLPHSDEPPCVGKAVRGFKIRLNDCRWPSDRDRAEGMKALAIAQLGSDKLDQGEFGKLMFLRGTQRLLSFVWRKEAERAGNVRDKTEMLAFCTQMEGCATFDEAKKVAKAAYASASASAYACAYADAYTYTYASASTSASAYACAYTYACAYAYAYADAYAHELLKLTAQVGVDVLKEMGSPGCKWLDLVGTKGAE